VAHATNGAVSQWLAAANGPAYSGAVRLRPHQQAAVTQASDPNRCNQSWRVTRVILSKSSFRPSVSGAGTLSPPTPSLWAKISHPAGPLHMQRARRAPHCYTLGDCNAAL